MTDSYFLYAGILLFVYIVLWDSPLVLIAMTGLVALGLADGYGLLPQWQG